MEAQNEIVSGMDDTYHIAGSTSVTGNTDRQQFDLAPELTTLASTSRDYLLPLHSDRLISAKDSRPVERMRGLSRSK